ncbi:aldehyde dehydrogenase [Thermoproteus uzoniensis 768-20]|uniref:L-glutamate gamma-semialdehyde dehydrogenase n=1 Tax=Thermoproteus uzoniensis (strain 768-20) TaxID=999630 RepID=F2L0D0_THEU7|nr:aldehyde dehydrogenase family protein [Thermoproteus uzoniensis]AEA12612.1 aldehyde dehydrogenase [Thermoproteus uzoniensis 768-20]
MSGKVTYVSVLADESIHPAYEKALSEVEELLGREWPIYIGGREVYTTGKFEKRSPIDVSIRLGVFQRGAELIRKMDGYRLPMSSPNPNERPLSVLRPYGAWFVISPFNFPIALAKGMLTGVLLMGNTAVWKPTSEAPFTATLVYQLAVEAGVPPGVLNLVTGPGDAVEDVATGDPRVAGIAFTGSRDVGMRLYRLFTQRQPWPKPIVLEMGSKNPTIVTAKADLDKAAEGVVRAAFGFGGQKCSATSRLYVQREVYDKFVERLVEKTKEIVKIGDPRRREVFLGPVINRSARENYKRYVADALSAGGRLRYGGRALEDGEFSKGFYVEPAIIEGVAPDSYLWKTELFLPILLVDRFDTLDEALRKANDTEYGLTAGIFSEDSNEVEYFFEHIEFGVVYANRGGGGRHDRRVAGRPALHRLEGVGGYRQRRQRSILPPQLCKGAGEDGRLLKRRPKKVKYHIFDITHGRAQVKALRRGRAGRPPEI